MQPILQQLEEKGFTLYVVTHGSEQDLEFLTSAGHRILVDPSGQAFAAYGVTGIPQTTFVDSDGKVAEVSVGWGGEDSVRGFMSVVDRLTGG